MTALLDGLPALVDVPDCVIAWRPSSGRRSRHWPQPDPCRDLDSFIVYRHDDLPELNDDGLRDQLALARSLFGNLLARSGSRVAERWLRERLDAINAEMRARQPPVDRQRERQSGPASAPAPKSARPPRFTAQPARRAP